MLGILLTILKIIGIILLVLIGLILLAAAVILLVPIRYHGEGAREEKILSGNVKLTWLLHMISASASLSEDGTKIRVCLFGKTIYPKTKKLPKKSKAKKMPKQEAPKSQRNQKSQNSSLILYLKMLQQSTSRKSQFQNCQRKKKRSLMRRQKQRKWMSQSQRKSSNHKKKNLPDQM